MSFLMPEYTSPQTGKIHIDLRGRDFPSLGVLARNQLNYHPHVPLLFQNPQAMTVTRSSAPLLIGYQI